jgi:hypothetical protein
VAAVTLTASGPRIARPVYEARHCATASTREAEPYVTLDGKVVDSLFDLYWTNNPRAVAEFYRNPGAGTMPGLAVDPVIMPAPDWRYKLASELLSVYQLPERIPYNRDQDNTLMTHIVPFMHEYSQSQSTPLIEEMFRFKNEAKCRAFDIYKGESNKRWYLEALLLAGANRKSIAIELHEDLDTLYWYSVTFFDVAPMRNRPSRAWMLILQPMLNRSGPQKPQDVVLKLLAYLGGVEAVLDYVSNAASTTPREIEVYQQLSAKLVYQQAAMALMNRRIHGGNEDAVIDCLAKLKELVPSEADKSADDSNHARMLMTSLSESLKMCKASEYEPSGREARAVESMANIWHRVGADTAGDTR